MVGAFADMFAHPIGHKFLGMGDSKMHPYDPNILTNQITDSGMLSFGGLLGWGIGGRKLFPQGVRAGGAPPDTWDDARTAIWPIKLGLMAARHAGMDIGTASKAEQSPYVDYTPMESLIFNSDWGLGVRKVRHNAEVIHAYYRYRQLVRKLELKSAATKDPELRRKYIENAKQLNETMQGMYNNHMNPAFK